MVEMAKKVENYEKRIFGWARVQNPKKSKNTSKLAYFGGFLAVFDRNGSIFQYSV